VLLNIAVRVNERSAQAREIGLDPVERMTTHRARTVQYLVEDGAEYFFNILVH
jgi:hypothetical protein